MDGTLAARHASERNADCVARMHFDELIEVRIIGVMSVHRLSPDGLGTHVWWVRIGQSSLCSQALLQTP